MWNYIYKSDYLAVEMANRHYSRIAFGKQGVMLGPPGRLISLMTEAQDAIWVSHWPYPEYALDHLDSWRCTIFRNEGPTLSSALITEAMQRTSEWWINLPPPADEWVTWVAPALVESRNPGYCFIKAGWWKDKDWTSSRKDVDLIRLRAHL
jgi:hypothetical protein